MFKPGWSALAAFALMSLGAYAEAHCPGNAASVHARRVAQYLNVVPVTLNRFGSYPFLVDTGAQITSLDPALAAELHLKAKSNAAVLGVSQQDHVLLSELEQLAVGEQHISHAAVAIQSLESLQVSVPGIRGVLGGDFLRHFDVLLDHANGLLCLGNAGKMRSDLHGERLALATLRAERDAVSTEPLVVSVRLSESPGRPLHLLLDSGANAPFLWRTEVRKTEATTRMAAGAQKVRALQNRGPAFAILPPQDMQIGRLTVHQISFAMPAEGSRDFAKTNVDGLLPTAQFRRVYIDYSHRFVVLEPW
jgi:gag-polyprotein putative aspartyl protease